MKFREANFLEQSRSLCCPNSEEFIGPSPFNCAYSFIFDHIPAPGFDQQSRSWIRALAFLDTYAERVQGEGRFPQLQRGGVPCEKTCTGCPVWSFRIMSSSCPWITRNRTRRKSLSSHARWFRSTRRTRQTSRGLCFSRADRAFRPRVPTAKPVG